MRILRLLFATSIVLAGLLFASPASAATISVCAVGCDYTTIQDAVTAAEATPAQDTINVASGTYPASNVKITQPTRILGAGAGTTILDGGGLNKQIFDIRPAATGEGEIDIQNMTLTNAGTATYAVYVGIKQPSTEITSIGFEYLKFTNGGTTGYGIYADSGVSAGANREAPPLEITDSEFVGTKYNNIGVDSYDGNVRIAGNDMHEAAGGNSAIFVGNEYTPYRLTHKMEVTNNTITDGRLFYLRNAFGVVKDAAGYDTVIVSDNVISGLGANDPGIFVGSNSVGIVNADPSIGSVTITGNRITGDLSAGSSGVTISGSVKDAKVNENNIVGLATAITVKQDNGDDPTTVTAQHNRLFADTNGLSNSTTAVVNAAENWWGCQTDPLLGGTYCSDAVNTGPLPGAITTAPWVVTTAALGSSTVEVNDTTPITTDLAHLSNGSSVSLPSFFAGLPTAFAAASGSVSPAAGTLSASFADASTYTAPAAPGPDTVTVSIDQEGSVTGQPVELELTVQARVVDPGDDGDGDGDGDGSDDDAALPDTGASTSWWQPLLAGGMLLLGAGIVWTGRARRIGGRRKLV